MRVLFLIPTLTGGGAERVMITLLRHLDRTRFQPMLAVVDSRQAVFLEDIPPDVEFFNLKCRRVRYAMPAILRLIWQTRPQLVFSTLGHLNLALAICKWLLPRAVKVMGRETILVSANLNELTFPAVWRSAYRHFYGRLDGVVCQSLAMQTDLVQRHALSLDKTVVIQNPLDLAEIRRLARQPVRSELRRSELELVAAGRFTAQKGFDLLLDALALCQDLTPHLSLLGEGPLDVALRAKAAALGISDHVDFVGYQKNPYAWFAHADAFVLSSRYEGLPNVVLEALACGTPVIATPEPGGTREIIESVPACQLAEAVSAEALAAAIRTWHARRPGRVANEAVSTYAVETIVRRYETAMLTVTLETP